METGSFRPESHVAQQSRRDKLRIQQSVHHLEDFPGNLEQLSVHPGLRPGNIQVRNIRNGNVLYDPATFSAEMLNFATSSNVLLAQSDAVVDKELGAVQASRPIPDGHSSFTSLSRPIVSSFNASPKASNSDPQRCGNWGRLDSLQNYDWMVNYARGSVGGERNHKFMFVGEVLSNNARLSNTSTAMHDLKPSYNGNQDVQVLSTLSSPTAEMSSEDTCKQFREMHFISHPLYPNTTQDFTSTSIRERELILPPSYWNQSTALLFDSSDIWMNRPVENGHQWSAELDLIARKSEHELRSDAVASDHANNTQGLSLSLSSNPPSKVKVAHFGEEYESEYLHSKTVVSKESLQDSKFAWSTCSGPMPKPSIITKGGGKSLHDMVGSSRHVFLRNKGPLGPFTGYSTILNTTRFLKPAQALLDELCSSTRSKFNGISEVMERTSEEGSAHASADAVNAADAETGANGINSSAVSSSTCYSSNEGSGEGGVGGSSCESFRPEYQQKKAKLLYLQEEICRKYKQYHQQMQMVASSFESVAGLSAAAPYVSAALKTVSRNFRSLKHAISDQLKLVTNVPAEDLLYPNTVSNGSKGDTSTSRLRYADQSFQKLKSSGANVRYLEPQQHIWRPHRGLPERSVSILRAWLFEHFLHPYPTDTDKHMLATQTGLSRNQVSNWFINARVRVWKPMVEEIHMIETKGSAEINQNAGKNAVEVIDQPNADQPSNKLSTNSTSNKQLESSGVGSSSLGCGEQSDAGQWNHEKRPRVEFEVPTSLGGSLVNFTSYQRSGIDNMGLGAVSLTLGLRHGAESVRRQQFQEDEDQFRRQFGGQIIHDLVG